MKKYIISYRNLGVEEGYEKGAADNKIDTKTLIASVTGSYNGVSSSVSVKSKVSDWESLTNKNFCYEVTQIIADPWTGDDDAPYMTLSNVVSLSYNSSSGVLTYTVNGTLGTISTKYNGNTAIYCNVNIYCIH